MSPTPRWLLPALLAPFTTLAATAALFALRHAPPGERLTTFYTLLVSAAIFGAMQSAALLAIDLLASAVRQRRLPTGLRAWGCAAVAPILATWVALFVPLPFETHPWLALFAACAIAAAPLRLALGPRWRAP
jgi:hypothetical protein